MPDLSARPEIKKDQQQITKKYWYDEFIKREGIPNITGFAIDDLKTVPVKPWARMDCLGTYINLDGTGRTNDAYVAEIPPGKKMAPEKHMFEEDILVVAGRGATLVGDPKNPSSFEWKTGSVFSVPLNQWHQHVNASGTEPARFLAVTTAPLLMNYFHNEEFIFNNPFVFEDRITDTREYQGEGRMWTGYTGRVNVWETNFIPDIETFQTFTWKERGAGGSSVMFELAHNTHAAHVSQFPVGTYKKAHKHGPGAHVIIISGTGYSLLWPDSGKVPEDVIRVDWKPGAMVVPPNGWFHQHFNGGNDPARYLAFRWGSQRYDFSLGVVMEGEADISVKLGGNQIEYEDEHPWIHDTFQATLDKVGGKSKMADFIPRLKK